MNRRVEQVSKLLQIEIGRCISNIQSNRLVTVSRVDLSPDLKNAKVFLSILDQDPKKSLEETNQKKGEILRCLKEKKLKLKSFPHLEFYEDKSGEYSQKIDKLLDQMK